MTKELQWEDFKLHPQKTAFILGSSPSIIDEPLHLLNGKIVYLVNKSWKALEMGLIHKCNGIMYAGLQSWIEHIDEMKEYGLDAIPKFYSDLVVNSHEFKEYASERDKYYMFPKRKAVSLGHAIKGKHLPNTFEDGIGKTGSCLLAMAASIEEVVGTLAGVGSSCCPLNKYFSKMAHHLCSFSKMAAIAGGCYRSW